MFISLFHRDGGGRSPSCDLPAWPHSTPHRTPSLVVLLCLACFLAAGPWMPGGKSFASAASPATGPVLESSSGFVVEADSRSNRYQMDIDRPGANTSAHPVLDVEFVPSWIHLVPPPATNQRTEPGVPESPADATTTEASIFFFDVDVVPPGTTGYIVYRLEDSASGPAAAPLIRRAVRITVASTAPAEQYRDEPVECCRQESAVPDAEADGIAAFLGASPNPFRGSTRLLYKLKEPAAEVILSVYDVQGRLVRRSVAGPASPGLHLHEWDGAGDHGRTLPAGVYLCKIEAGTWSGHVKVVRLQ